MSLLPGPLDEAPYVLLADPLTRSLACLPPSLVS